MTEAITCPLTGRPLATRVPPSLTTSAEKAFFYAQEIYFREAWRDAEWAFGARAIEWMQQLSFVLFKPDGILARSVEPALDVLRSEGFEPVAAVPFRFDRRGMRELWRYELNLATLQRLDAIDLLLTSTESLLVVLRAPRDLEHSAAARLCALKGPSQRERRQPHHLRSRVGAGTGMLNHVHTPDEPADVIRELGVLLPTERRREALRAVTSPRPLVDSLEAMRDVYDRAPQHDLDVPACATRIARTCEARLSGADRSLALDHCDRVRAGLAADWQQVLHALEAVGIEVAIVERAVFAAAATECNLPGIAPFLEYPLVGDHRAGRVA